MFTKKYRVKKSHTDIEPHEIFLDTLAKSKEEEIGVSEKKFEVPLKNQISYSVFVVFVLIALFLFSKVFYFQLIQGKQITIEAENNKGSANLLMPERGIIYDKNLEPLVFNYPAYDLVCDRNYFSDNRFSVEGDIENLSDAVGITKEDFVNKIEMSDSAEVLISGNITHENLLNIESKISDIIWCNIKKNTVRNYVFGPSFAHVLGYIGRINRDEYTNAVGYAINDYIGKVGLEKEYEEYLRGIPGQSNPRRSTAEIKSDEDILIKPEPGDNVVLNIDSKFQSVLYNLLEQKINDIGSKKGAAVAMDPRTGAVLAMVSYPSYDNNSFSGGISQKDFQEIQNNPYQPLFNRAISAQYATGSVIKPFEASAALQENLISPDKQINDPGYILVQSQYDPDIVYRFGGVEPHGLVDMRKALAVSSNIYFYTIGGGYGDQKGLGPSRIKEYLSLFGWDKKTGIDLPGEFSGFIPDPEWKKRVKGESWYDGDTYNLSIGQSDLQATPLQVASAYSAIANGGTLYKPQILNKVIKGSGESAETIKEFSPEIIRSNFINSKNLSIVREGMRDSVIKDYGTSRMLSTVPVTVAAKTGTAQIPIREKYNLWSAVFAPYENPEIVLVVAAEEVGGLSSVTLPIARDALNWYFSR